MDLRDPRGANDVERPLERRVVLARKADDDVGREVEAGERLDAGEVLLRAVAAMHRAQDPVVAGLERDVNMAGHCVRALERIDEVGRHVIDLDRGEAEPVDSRDRARLTHELRKPVPGLAIAEAAEVDTREHDLAMSLGHAAPYLAEHVLCTPAPRAAAHERDHAERARERAAVLDLHERARALEPGLALDAADRADVAGDRRGCLLAGLRDDVHVLGQPSEGTLEVRRAAGDVDAVMSARSPCHGLPRLGHRLVRHAARVDDRDVRFTVALHVPVGEQPLTSQLRIREGHLAAEEAHGEGRHRSREA